MAQSPSRNLDNALDALCPRCHRTLFLQPNTNPRKQPFAACPGYPAHCAFTAIRLGWTKPCHICCEDLQEGTVTWSYALEGERSSTGKQVYANFCLDVADCILKQEDGVPVNARKAGDSDVDKTCKDCKKDDEASSTIVAGDHLVAASARPWHIGCALKIRNSFIEKITAAADERAAKTSAERERTAQNSSNETNKRPREALIRGEALDLS